MESVIHWQQLGESVILTRIGHLRNGKSRELLFLDYKFANLKKDFTSKSIWLRQKERLWPKHWRWLMHKLKPGSKTEELNGGKDSISLTFYDQLFCAKLLCAAFFLLTVLCFVIFWQNHIGAKTAHKLLVKLRKSLTFINILWSAFFFPFVEKLQFVTF